MQLPPTITFRGVRRTNSLETDILARVHRLERYYPRITGCRVAIEPAGRRRRTGNPYRVRIDLTIPGGELVVAESDSEPKHVRLAIREAFHSARRRLQDYSRLQRDARSAG